MCDEETKKANRDELLNIWTTYSGYCEEITNKRQTINAFFLGMISAIIGVITGLWGVIGIVLSSLGLVITIFWFLMIKSFKKLNSAKFDVLLGIEEKLGIKIYSLEWEKCKEKKYVGLTTIEFLLLILFILGFVALIIISSLKAGGVM